MKMKVAAILAMMLFVSAQAQAQEKAAPVAGTATGVVVKAQTMCPIMGGVIDKTKFVDQDGTRIFVCCGGCVAPLKKDFAAIKAKLEKEGITLEKTPVKAAE